MAEIPKEERRVLAILFSDIVDYTLHMAESEPLGVRLRDLHQRCWANAAAEFGGRIADENGDELLLLFASAVDAVRAADRVQDAIEADGAMRLRVGIHVADVLIRDGRPFGEGVNLAARIRAEAEPAQTVLSEEVNRALRNQGDFHGEPLGSRTLKNISEPVVLYKLMEGDAVPVRAKRRQLRRATAVAAGSVVFALVLGLMMPETRGRLAAGILLRITQVAPPIQGHEVSFVLSADGTRIAWGSLGSGPPLLFIQPWLTHAEMMPRGLPLLAELAQRHRVVHFDGRGFGLSQRGVEFSFEKQIQDIEAVVDAAGLDRFAIWSVSSGTPSALVYSVRNPESVTRLAVLGGWARSIRSRAEAEAIAVLMREHFGSNRFESFFRELLVPDASDFEVYFLNQAFGPNGNREDMAAYFRMLTSLDVRDSARAIRVPTLIAHRRGDQLIDFESGLELASLIPDAKLVLFEGQNHFFLPGEAEGRRFAMELTTFLAAAAAEDPGT